MKKKRTGGKSSTPAHAARNADGAPACSGPSEWVCRAAVNDITGRKRAAEALRESETRYRALFDNMVEGFAYCRMLFENGQPKDFIYLAVNEAFGKLTGLRDVVGRKVTEVIPGIREADPELFAIYGRVALTGRTERFEIYVKALDMWFFISVYSPEKEYFVAMFDVITERKRTEIELARNVETQTALNALLKLSTEDRTLSEFLAGALELIQSLPWLAFDSRCAIFLADEAKQTLRLYAQTGFSNAQLAQCSTVPFGRCLCGRAAAERVIQFADCLDERHDIRYEGIRPHGHYAEPILSGDRVLGVINFYVKEGHIRNPREEEFLKAVAATLAGAIEHKRADEALREMNAELTRFAYAVSHDLKSPLVTITNFLGYLEADLRARNPEAIAKDMDYIRTAADKMERLLNELLEIARVGRKTNPPVEAPLREIVREALTLTAEQVAARGVKVEVSAEPVLLHGDRPRLVEVFQNLVDNAVKFMDGQAAPLVEIGTEQAGGETVFFVRDNGKGIDPRHRGKLFGLFEKLDPKSEGIGIGLALVKRIVETHGGRIWAESEGVGKGACFKFTLGGDSKK